MDEEIKYTQTYEIIKVSGNKGRVGISKEASDKLGDICLIDLPEIGRIFKKDEEVATIESIKAASDVYNPVDGKVTAINEKLKTKPELISNDPLGNGWIYEIEILDKAQLDLLMNYSAFLKFINQAG